MCLTTVQTKDQQNRNFHDPYSERTTGVPSLPSGHWLGEEEEALLSQGAKEEASTARQERNATLHQNDLCSRWPILSQVGPLSPRKNRFLEAGGLLALELGPLGV